MNTRLIVFAIILTAFGHSALALTLKCDFPIQTPLGASEQFEATSSTHVIDSKWKSSDFEYSREEIEKNGPRTKYVISRVTGEVAFTYQTARAAILVRGKCIPITAKDVQF
ncbi:hypothetical protein D3C71_1598770 [compost metagenome]